jgi:hypothetical protein
MRDLMDRVHLQPAFAPKAAVTDNTAQVSSSCDTKGFSSSMLAFLTGTLSDADATLRSRSRTARQLTNGPRSPLPISTAPDARRLPVRRRRRVPQDRLCRHTALLARHHHADGNNTGNLFVAGMFVLGGPSRQPTANPPQ